MHSDTTAQAYQLTHVVISVHFLLMHESIISLISAKWLFKSGILAPYTTVISHSFFHAGLDWPLMSLVLSALFNLLKQCLVYMLKQNRLAKQCLYKLQLNKKYLLNSMLYIIVSIRRQCLLHCFTALHSAAFIYCHSLISTALLKKKKVLQHLKKQTNKKTNLSYIMHLESIQLPNSTATYRWQMVVLHNGVSPSRATCNILCVGNTQYLISGRIQLLHITWSIPSILSSTVVAKYREKICKRQ